MFAANGIINVENTKELIKILVNIIIGAYIKAARYKVNISQSLSHVLAMSNGIWKKKDIHMTLFSKRNIWLKIWQNMYDINTRETINFDLKTSK